MYAHASPIDPACDHGSGRVARERGFSTLEIIVVVAIILILLSIAFLGFRGAKKSTKFQAASAAAVAYADGIEAYMADNGQVPPALGSSSWPAGSRDQRISGPLNLMLTAPGSSQPRPYVNQTALDKVKDGLVDFGTSSGSAQAGAAAYITYAVAGGTYTLTVETLPGSSGDEVLRCVVTNAATPPSGVQRC